VTDHIYERTRTCPQAHHVQAWLQVQRQSVSPALTELDVGSNELMNIGASALCIALAHCPRLAHLELSNNR